VSLSVRAAAREAPGQPALVTPEGITTWEELCERVLAEGRRVAGLGPTSRPLAFTAGVDAAALVRLLAAVEIGRPALPLHPSLPRDAREPLVRALGATDLVDAEAGSPSPAPLPAPPDDDDRPLALVRTSGSAGAAKAVELSRAAFVASAAASARRLGWRQDDRWLLVLPLAHVGGLSIVVRCLAARRPVVLAGEGSRGDLFGAIERLGVTLVSLVPTMLRHALDADGGGGPVPAGLRVVLLGGARPPASLLAEAAARGVPVVVTYGLTEACSQVATGVPGEPPGVESGAGPPLPGTEVRIVEGRIEVRSPSLLTRYLPDGAWPSPFTADGWLRTEDLGRLDGSGRLHVLGRADGAITSGGVTVLPGEVEAALESLPEVAEALVVGRPDPVWGERIAALVVPAGAMAADLVTERLRQFAAGLPPAQRPRAVAVVDRLPRTAMGKLDRRAAVTLPLTWQAL
jgi:O-succinylbenzoic acid--CoA ligase